VRSSSVRRRSRSSVRAGLQAGDLTAGCLQGGVVLGALG
jgi:hypothetical protein